MAIKTTVKNKEKYTVETKDNSEKEKNKKNKNTKTKKTEEKVGFFKSSIQELKKVTWPSKKMTFNYTIATLIFCVLFGLFFFLCDLIFLFVKGLFS